MGFIRDCPSMNLRGVEVGHAFALEALAISASYSVWILTDIGLDGRLKSGFI